MKRVSPVHKGDVKTDPRNLRPISILPIPMKFFDIKTVIKNAYCHLYADDTIILKGASGPDSL